MIKFPNDLKITRPTKRTTGNFIKERLNLLQPNKTPQRKFRTDMENYILIHRKLRLFTLFATQRVM